MDTTLVTFKIGFEFYGIDIMEVQEIISLLEITPIPNSPSFVDGVINLRGGIIPVVDLGKRFNFEIRELTEEEERLRGIIIIKVEGMIIGVIIDQVNRVEYIQGVSKTDDNLLTILNVKKLFSKQELLQLSNASGN